VSNLSKQINKSCEKSIQHGEEPKSTIHSFYCSICMSFFETNESKTIPNSCNHEFCFECINTWTKLKLRCPVCWSLISTLQVLEKDNLKEIELEAPNIQPVKETYISQNEYFYSQATQLLNLAELTKKQLFGNKQRFSKNWDVSTERSWTELQRLISDLQTHRGIFRNGDYYEFDVVLSHLYSIHDLLQELRGAKYAIQLGDFSIDPILFHETIHQDSDHFRNYTNEDEVEDDYDDYEQTYHRVRGNKKNYEFL